MLTLKMGAIKSFTLPEGFTAGTEQDGGRGDNWLRSYHPQGNEEVEITACYRGFPLNEKKTEKLRSFFNAPARDIFLKGKTAGPAAVLDVRALSPLLGNAGNNQVDNLEPGLGGPIFELERLAVAQIQDRKLIRVWGWFHATDHIPQNFYTGLFIDASPAQPQSKLEELYLQTYTQDLFQTYAPQFDQLLESITWDH